MSCFRVYSLFSDGETTGLNRRLTVWKLYILFKVFEELVTHQMKMFQTTGVRTQYSTSGLFFIDLSKEFDSVDCGILI